MAQYGEAASNPNLVPVLARHAIKYHQKHDQWKKKAIETYDPDFVRSKLFIQAIIDQLGSEYSTINAWLKSLDKVTDICSAFEERWKEELQSIRNTVSDATTLVSTILWLVGCYGGCLRSPC